MSQNNPYGNYPYGGSPYYPYENNEPELRQQNPNPQQGYPQQGYQQPSYQPQQPTMAGTPQQMPVTMGQPLPDHRYLVCFRSKRRISRTSCV